MAAYEDGFVAGLREGTELIAELEAERDRIREALEDLNISGTCTFCELNAKAINAALGKDIWETKEGR